jgi:hypothetical protein
MFASTITPVQIVASLASATASEGATAVLTTDGKYRYHSGAWTSAVPVGDIQTAGTIDITKFASGLPLFEDRQFTFQGQGTLKDELLFLRQTVSCIVIIQVLGRRLFLLLISQGS